MNRNTTIIAILLAILTLLVNVNTTATAEDTTFFLGDSDGDGNLSITDATMIQRDAAQLQLLPLDNLNAADIDHDGFITIMDSSLIQRWLANLKVSYPIGKTVTESYLNTIYPINSPSESIQIAPTVAPTQVNIADEIEHLGRTS